jgi:hypothetical protein
MTKQTQQQRDFDNIINQWDEAEAEVFRLQTLNMQLQQDYNRAWERLKSQRREIDELQKKLEQHERLEHEIKALFGIEMLQAVQDFADKLKTRLEAKEQHYICMYDWNGHSAVVDCENEVDKLLKELRK